MGGSLDGLPLLLYIFSKQKFVSQHIGTYQGFNLFLRKTMLYESYEIIIHENFNKK